MSEPSPTLLTLLRQALGDGRASNLLHIPIQQNLVVGGQAAEPQLVCAQEEGEGRSEDRGADPNPATLCPPCPLNNPGAAGC